MIDTYMIGFDEEFNACPQCGHERMTFNHALASHRDVWMCHACCYEFRIERQTAEDFYAVGDEDWSDPDYDDDLLGTFYVDVSDNLHYLSPGFPADPELLDPDYHPDRNGDL